MEPRRDIKELSLEELADLFEKMGQPAFRAAQVYNWVFGQGVARFEDMTNLPQALRAELGRAFFISRLKIEEVQTSKDRTAKFLLRLRDGQRIEAVLIPERDHWTLCASSQVGCQMGCRFCLTGAGGLVRNLTPAEIIGQVQAAAEAALGLIPEGLPLSNIVFMGMGEPLANLDNLLPALKVILDPRGLAFSWRKVTVSTVGLPQAMARLFEEVKVRLAISLNGPDDETRNKIMPVNRRHPLDQLLAACRRLPLRPGERITFEYVLLAGVNDSLDQAAKLVRLLAPVRAKVNLIPFNPHPASPFERPSDETVAAFQARLRQGNLTALVRRSMGADILAACGQLRARSARTG
ncbi:MAG: 23S rRNA (adenine(2503)-C(2))-methyltransferase RlmN [Deltaproteobacteria bacterium]|nr:23S rRNA (adenine(2503)-C(2))-methyltransferase RlmN [Deltaproteobacteria bacterium]